MRFSNADISLIETQPKRQAIDAPDFRVYSYEQEPSMNTSAEYQPPIDAQKLLERRDVLYFVIALIICRSKETLSRKQIAKRAGTTKSKTIRRTDWAEEDGVVNHKDAPHANEGMPPTREYFGTSQISIETLEWCLENARYREALPTKSIAKRSAPIEGIKSHTSPELLTGVVTVSVNDFLKGHQRSVRRSYLALLVQVLRYGELTVRQASELFGEQPQTQHGRIMRLLEENLLMREKKRSGDGSMEYHYRLSQYASSGEVLGLAKSHRISTSKQLVNVEATTSEEMTITNTPAQTGKNSQASATELLVNKLPEFDPTWPQEVKESWFQAYQQLIGMVQK